MEQTLRSTSDPSWLLVSGKYDPLRESVIGSRFAISNGFLGLRGERATTRGARWAVPSRTYVAGLFDTAGSDHAMPELVPAANWLRVRVLLSGKPLVHHAGDHSSHHVTLDMKQGTLLGRGEYNHAPDLNVRVATLRLVSLADRALGLQIIELEVESGTAKVTLEAEFEGIDLGLVVDHIEQNIGVWRTHHSGKRLAMASASSCKVDDIIIPPTALGPLKFSWSWTARPRQRVSFERIVSVTRRDDLRDDPGVEARMVLENARQIGWRGVLEAHKAAWMDRWRESEVRVEGDAPAQHALRFAIYHLNSAANPADERVSIGARGLTGDDYRGHVFWDTEIFLVPFYTLTWPEAARTLLMYRFHTLDAARTKASSMGWRGAMYAWESADTGEEATPEQVVAPDGRIVDVLCGKQEQHISADVAYAVWQYWLATADEVFLQAAGAEIILETARFWVARAVLEGDGHYHIRGVIGPDEYHESIDDNAYTNVMAQWNVRRGLEVALLLREKWPGCWLRLCGHLGLDDGELGTWRNVADKIVTGFEQETGLYEQFEGYFGLEDLDLSAYTGRSVPIDMVLGKQRTQQSQVIKQADVVALLTLLPDELPEGAARANFSYYEPRCSHGSSLSPAMHGLVAARLGDSEKALGYLRQAAQIDLLDGHVAGAHGVHMAALGGLWMLVVFGFAGLSSRTDALAINPQLPAGWRCLAFNTQWRQRHIHICVDNERQRLEATLVSGKAMTLIVGDVPHDLGQGSPLLVSIAVSDRH